MGYKPKVTSPAVTTMTVYQLVPAISDIANKYSPNPSYFLKIKDGMEITSTTNPNIVFRTTDSVDFSNEIDREVDVYERNPATGEPQFYLVSKKVKAISAKEKDTTITFGDTTDYPFATINETNIIGITSVVTDGTNTKWYEVPYLAQESIFVEQPNTEVNSGDLSASSSIVPYIL